MKRSWGLERGAFVALLCDVLAAERAPAGEVGVAFVGDRTMRRLNRDYRGKDETTDVLSFSYLDAPHAGEAIGEIYVSPAVASRQADEAGCPLAEELARLTLHGLLHVLGWTHDTAADRRRMLRRQERHLARLDGRRSGSAAPC